MTFSTLREFVSHSLFPNSTSIWYWNLFYIKLTLQLVPYQFGIRASSTSIWYSLLNIDLVLELVLHIQPKVRDMQFQQDKLTAR